jgi:putative protease
LYKVFNRDFSNGFLKGSPEKNMFIDDPRDHSIQHLSEVNHYATSDELEKAHLVLYDDKENVKTNIKQKIGQLNIEKEPLIVNISGVCGSPLKVFVKTPGSSFEVYSEMNLAETGTEPVNYDMVFDRLKAINETAYYIHHLELNIESDVYLPYKELTFVKKKILFLLNGSIEMIGPIHVPVLKKHIACKIQPTLSVLISSEKDLFLCEKTDADIYYQLPDSFKNKKTEFFDLFKNKKKLVPWFPSVLIGDDFAVAVELLHQVHPKTIVTNNTGIAYEASQLRIPWIAGPFMNVINSYSLLGLKEIFNCSGSFISNEMSKIQIQQIKRPVDFKLYYSIYHPIVLMTSRQCLFHQVTGCEKNKIDKACVSACEKTSSITNLKNQTSFIEKSKGNYHRVFHQTHFLNADIVSDMQTTFSGFLIDLTDVKTETITEMDKSGLIKLFENLLNGEPGSKSELHKIIHPSTNTQYTKGI